MAAEAVGELVKCRQDDGESAIDYYNKTQALLKICGRMESSYVYEFMSGLRNQEVKKFITMGNYGNAALNMHEIAIHAQQADSRASVIKGVTKSRIVSSISAVKGERVVRSRERPSAPSRDGGGKRGGGAGVVRKERPRTTVNAVQCSEPEVTHWKYKKWSMKECLDYFQTRVPPGTIVGRCMGCLSKGHRWDGNFGTCITKKCPFCGASFFSKWSCGAGVQQMSHQQERNRLGRR